jgi:hypothetical protein
MFVYDISLTEKSKLPPLHSWLSPKYNGPGDYASREAAGTLPEGVNKPENWKDDFPGYNYTYDDNLELKAKLNAEKNRITPIRSTPASDKKFNAVSTACNRYEDLRGRNGVLVRQYGAEIVTNAWMKMYECMDVIRAPLLNKLTKTPSRDFNTFHIAEAPGNFMVAINHYMFSHFPQVTWNWAANSYRDLYSHRSFYLSDTYGLMKNYKDDWIFGADGDGDITSPANLRSFANEIEKRFENGLHFVTSDVKFVPPDSNYDEEEWQNIPVQMGHMIASLMTLKKGGAMMLKEFTYFEAPKTSHLYLLAHCFTKLLVVKPETSRAANSEVYLIGIGYKKNLSELQIMKLLDEMQYVRYMVDSSPSIFKRDDIPESFVKRVHELNAALVEKQIPAISRNVSLFQQYEDVPYQEICKDMSSLRAKSAQEWVKKYGIKDLPQKSRIATFNN